MVKQPARKAIAMKSLSLSVYMRVEHVLLKGEIPMKSGIYLFGKRIHLVCIIALFMVLLAGIIIGSFFQWGSHTSSSTCPTQVGSVVVETPTITDYGVVGTTRQSVKHC